MSIDVNVTNDLVIVTESSEDVSVNVSNAQGPAGAAGQGVPVGGTTNQVLKKLSGTNYDTYWAVDNEGVPYSGASGNVNLGAFTLTAASLIKSGGTSSQFLKADGSVDSTTYTPSTRNITINGTTQDLSADRTFTVSAANIYTDDGTLAGNRIITSNGNSLTILGGKETFTGYQRALWLKTSTNAKSSVELILENTFTTTGRTFEVASYSDGSFNISDRTAGELRLKINPKYFQFHSDTSSANLLGEVGPINALWFNETASTASTSNYMLCRNSGSAFLNAPTGSIYFRIGNADKALLTNAGRLLLGTTTESTFILDVNGTARVSGNLEITAGSILKFSDNRVQIGTSSATANFGIAIGSSATTNASEGTAVGNSASTNGGSASVAIGRLASTTGGGISIGGGSTSVNGVAIQGTSTGSGITIGGTASSGGLSLGLSSVSNSFNSVAIGREANASHNPSIAIGYRAITTAANQCVIGGADAGVLGYSITDVYIGSGVQDGLLGNAVNVTINASGGGAAINKTGGNITIAGGKGTGSGASGDIIFSTATTTTSGTTLQSLTERFKVFGNTGNVLIQNGGTFTDAGFKLDVNGTARVSGALTLQGTGGIAASIASGSAIRGSISNATWYLDAGSDLTGTINLRATTFNFPSGSSTANDFIITAASTLFTTGSVTVSSASVASFRINNTASATNWFFENHRNAASGSLEISNSISSPTLTLFPSRSISLGTYTETTSAIFAIDSTTKGLLPPRMTTTQKNAIGTPAQGLMVFDTTLVKLCVYSGTAWETITSI